MTAHVAPDLSRVSSTHVPYHITDAAKPRVEVAAVYDPSHAEFADDRQPAPSWARAVSNVGDGSVSENDVFIYKVMP